MSRQHLEGLIMASDGNEHEYWDKVAHRYDADHHYIVRDLDNEIRLWLTRQVSEHDTLLELGCGTGLFSEMIVGCVSLLRPLREMLLDLFDEVFGFAYFCASAIFVMLVVAYGGLGIVLCA